MKTGLGYGFGCESGALVPTLEEAKLQNDLLLTAVRRDCGYAALLIREISAAYPHRPSEPPQVRICGRVYF